MLYYKAWAAAGKAAVKQGLRFPEKGSLVEVKRAQAPSRQIVKELGTLNSVCEAKTLKSDQKHLMMVMMMVEMMTCGNWPFEQNKDRA